MKIIDEKKVNVLIVKNDLIKKDVLEKVNMCYYTYKRKMNGESSWKYEDVIKLCNILNCDDVDILTEEAIEELINEEETKHNDNNDIKYDMGEC